MNEVWNLDPIYHGFDDPAFERDMQALKASVSGLETFARTLEAVLWPPETAADRAGRG